MKKYAIIWLVLALGIGFCTGRRNLRKYYHLSVRGLQGEATVLQLQPEIHQTTIYRYQAGGKTLQGQGQSDSPNPPLEQLRVGQRVIAYYDPLDPATSVLENPTALLKNEAISVGCAAITLPTFAAIILMNRKPRNRQAPE